MRIPITFSRIVPETALGAASRRRDLLRGAPAPVEPHALRDDLLFVAKREGVGLHWRRNAA